MPLTNLGKGRDKTAPLLRALSINMNPDKLEKIAKDTINQYPKELSNYIRYLFDNRENSIIVPAGEIDGGEWQPRLNDCHNNVDRWCAHNKEFKPARGWLFYDLGYEADFVMFQQHSVLADDKGRLIDITPTKASDSFPFIYVSETDEQYFSKEPALVNGNLFYAFR
jgi:hypothetical protein